MKSIIIYNIATGDIVRCISCPESMIESQTNSGEGFIEHDRVDDTAYKVDLNTLEIIPVE